MKRWLCHSFLFISIFVLSFSLVAAQDKTTTRQRAALNNLLAVGDLAVEAGDLLQNDDFSSENEWQLYKDKDIVFSYGSEAYRMTVNGSFYTWSLDYQDHSDVVIEVEAAQLSEDTNNEYGVICRADTSDNGDGYYFFVSGDGYFSIAKGSDEGLDSLVDWESSDVINQGEDVNDLVVVCVDDYLALYANGELLAETHDDSYTEGYAGFSVGAFEENTATISFDNMRVWDASGAGGSNSPVALALTEFGGDSEDTISELESLGLIPSGSSLIFGEDYAFFTGQGSWFTSLASNQPRTNIVFGGELTFTVGDEDEFEECGLISRIDTDSQGTATTYVEVGLINDGRVSLYDRFSESADGNEVLSDQVFDLSEPHHFVILLIDDQANVFVDGELVISDYEVVKRVGTYGISLVGQGASAKCEGRDIWAYQVPTSTTGECTVNSSRDVNKRTGPGTDFDNAGQLSSGTDATVIGQAIGSDGLTWWQLDDETWVREDVVSEAGDCTGVPEIEA